MDQTNSEVTEKLSPQQCACWFGPCLEKKQSLQSSQCAWRNEPAVVQSVAGIFARKRTLMLLFFWSHFFFWQVQGVFILEHPQVSEI